jgi:hypothetical protein
MMMRGISWFVRGKTSGGQSPGGRSVLVPKVANGRLF